MKEISLKAYGKVNIGLDVCGRRQDGYHLVNMVMQTVDIYDEICVRAINDSEFAAEADWCLYPAGSVPEECRGIAEAGRRSCPAESKNGYLPIKITVNTDAVPGGRENLAYKAAALIMETYSIISPVEINIKKNIPAAGGMAGGSTDAAAVLMAMNELFALRLAQQELDNLAVKLGADVPFCLRRGTYLAQGIGEKLTKLKGIPQCAVLIANPGFGVSTKWAYSRLDIPGFEAPHPDIDGLCAAIEAGDLSRVCTKAGNILETVVFPEHPEIEKIKLDMKKHGALAALMTGTGATVFGIFENTSAARNAEEFLKHNGNLSFCRTVLCIA